VSTETECDCDYWHGEHRWHCATNYNPTALLAEEVAEVAVGEREALTEAFVKAAWLDPDPDGGKGDFLWAAYCDDVLDKMLPVVAALTAKAKAEGRVEALREAADDLCYHTDGIHGRADAAAWLRERADREAT
jgi:hypothetical protein